MTSEEAVAAANAAGLPGAGAPVAMCLGGQNMIIAYQRRATLQEYMTHHPARRSIENPVLIDKYLMGIEVGGGRHLRRHRIC